MYRLSRPHKSGKQQKKHFFDTAHESVEFKSKKPQTSVFIPSKHSSDLFVVTILVHFVMGFSDMFHLLALDKIRFCTGP